MKPSRVVHYFPIGDEEQRVLLRLREPDLADRLPEVLDLLDLIADRPAGKARDALLREPEPTRDPAIEARLTAIEARLEELRKAPAQPVLAHPPTPPAPPTPTPTPPPSPPAVHAAVKFVARVGGVLVQGTSGADFFAAVWRWLWDNGHVRESDLPVPAGRTRHRLARTNVHPSGNAFFAPKELHDGLWLEANLSKRDILKQAEEAVTSRKLTWELVQR